MSQRFTDLKEPHTPSLRTAEGVSMMETGVGGPPRGTPSPSVVWRVLVVENNISEAEVLVRGLRRHGHEVDSVDTGGAALQNYENADLVLLDLELPDLDGLVLQL